MINDRLISLSDTANILGVSKDYLRRLSEEDLPVIKTKGGHRKYKESIIKDMLNIKSQEALDNNKVVVYARVSSHDQKKKGDLDRQKNRLLEYCIKQKYDILSIFEEVGSGMNDKRSKLRQLFKLIDSNKIRKVVVEHKDRLTRFNFSIYESYFNSHDVKIEVLEKVLDKSFENELVEDILSLMASFSAKIYGKRSHQNSKKKNK